MELENKPSRPDIDFEDLLATGADAYNTEVGSWWQELSLDEPHRRAYKHIAQSAAKFCKEMKVDPAWIADYACGSGNLLKPLRVAFPQAKLLGIDGAEKLLEICQENQKESCELRSGRNILRKPQPQMILTQSSLPNFKLPKGKMDLLFLVFPNLIPDPDNLHIFDENGYGNSRDVAVAEMLARFREMDPEDETLTPPKEELFDDLLTARVYSRNLRHLLKPGGILARAEYTQAPREELTELTQWRCLFAECALGEAIKGKRAYQLFQYLGSEYKRSEVILDVYYQTGDVEDTQGGYMISYFKAI
ncbi:MAG: class I SAM-dependent methyltransferase [Fibrobacter sp.]|nr:class I SAM-dependent methyltransferase [Fibrobacter sp.]